MATEQDDDDRHRREEADRRAKRKASKHNRTAEQIEKDEQRKKYRQEILQKHGASSSTTTSTGIKTASSHQKRPTPPTGRKPITAPVQAKEATGSAFQELFGTRAQGFQIEFRFRNAPPRPPVGPCFVGESIDTLLYNAGKQYKPLNTVEVHHTWKLHTESDIGVPLAPSAMDLRSYKETNNYYSAKLHPDDVALLDWTGSLGDTSAEQLKIRQEQTRASALLAALGRTTPFHSISSSAMLNKRGNSKTGAQQQKEKTRKEFSRVLKDDKLQTWMKKTTYLSNDYSRKVHDFKSLAKTKTELAVELEKKQKEMAVRRTVKSIEESFSNPKTFKHPTNSKLKVKNIYPILPDVENFGHAFTHVVIDKMPVTLLEGQTCKLFFDSFVTDVERNQASARMICSVVAPVSKDRISLFNQQLQSNESNDSDNGEKSAKFLLDVSQPYFEPIQAYDLDVMPLKDDEDAPHSTFALTLDKEAKTIKYIPLASRVSLSTGRPPYKTTNVSSVRLVKRRALTYEENVAIEEQIADMDIDLAEKHHSLVSKNTRATRGSNSKNENTFSPFVDRKKSTNNDFDDGEDDEDAAGEDESEDSDDNEVFGSGTKTIVASEN